MSGSDALLVARCFECWLFWVAALESARHETGRVTAGGTDSAVAKLLATISLKARSDRNAEFLPAGCGSKLTAVVVGNSRSDLAGDAIESLLLDRICDLPERIGLKPEPRSPLRN